MLVHQVSIFQELTLQELTFHVFILHVFTLHVSIIGVLSIIEPVETAHELLVVASLSALFKLIFGVFLNQEAGLYQAIIFLSNK